MSGEVADVYSPTSGNVDSIRDSLVRKANPEKQQAANIVVNLADSPLSAADVASYIQRNPVAGMKSLTIVKSGKVVVLKAGN